MHSKHLLGKAVSVLDSCISSEVFEDIQISARAVYGMHKALSLAFMLTHP